MSQLHMNQILRASTAVNGYLDILVSNFKNTCLGITLDYFKRKSYEADDSDVFRSLKTKANLSPWLLLDLGCRKLKCRRSLLTNSVHSFCVDVA